MNDQKTREKLLHDILFDEEVVAFTETLKARCHKELAYKRQPMARKKWIILAAAAVLLIVLRLGFLTDERDRTLLVPPLSDIDLRSYYVSTIPIAEEQLVSTPALAWDRYVVHTEFSLVAVRTQPLKEFQKLTDEEMLAMFPGTPMGLKKTGKKQKKLLFLKDEDQALYMVDLGG